MKREADPNRSAASAVSLPLRVRLRRLPSLSSFTNGPRRAHSPCYRLHARPQLLYQPLPFQLTQRERAGQRRRRWRRPPPRRREGAREGGRSETRHLKLAPTKTTTTAAGRSRERADGRTADADGQACWSCPNRLSSFRKSLHLQRRRRRRLELLTTVQSVHGCAVGERAARRPPAMRAAGGRWRRCTRRAGEDLSLNSRKTDPKMTENKSSEEDEGGEEEERSGEESQ